MTTATRGWAVLLAASWAVGVGAPAGAREDARKDARAILDATGVRGGLVVHVGCGDGRLTAALGRAAPRQAGDGALSSSKGAGEGANGSYLVHGLDADASNVAAARERLLELGLSGDVSVDLLDEARPDGGRLEGGRLPYIDNLVNLVVVEEPGAVSMEEVTRVLAPGGVAYVKEGRRWSKTVKPRPAEIDEWSHYFRDAGGTCVSDDRLVAHPRRLQWEGSPRWSRHHDHAVSMQALVTAGGRVFHVADEGSRASIQLPSKWMLTARDAFNGIVLWKRALPGWNNHLFPLKSGPAAIAKRLVASAEAVYVSPGTNKPFLGLDAATGEVKRTYDATTVEDMVLSSVDREDVLFVLEDLKPKENTYRQQHSHCWGEAGRARREFGPTADNKRLAAIAAEAGEVLWRKERRVWPMTLAAAEGRVYFYDGRVVCLDGKTGGKVWESEPVKAKCGTTEYAPRLAVRDGTVYFSPHGTILAFDAATGEVKWTVQKKPRSGHNCIEDFFVMKDRVWAFDNGRKTYVSWDVESGQPSKKISCKPGTYFMHQRCYPGKATVRFLLAPRTGTSFVDIEKGDWQIQHWARGGCIYGVMPANGLLYLPPHACACYMQTMLNGMNALGAGGSEWPAGGERSLRGPAYGDIPGDAAAGDGSSWPVFRHDNRRSSHVRCKVPSRLTRAWKTKVGGRLTQPVAAGGRVLLASVDRHAVHALDRETGRELWRYVAGGRVDSPPALGRGMAVFGCADGYVYALRVTDGELVWRTRAAPADRRLVSYGRLESVWPLHGSVLIVKDTVYCVAGRNMFLDGGMSMVRLDVETGRLLSETKMAREIPGTRKTLQDMMKARKMPVATKDVLSSGMLDGGEVIFMKTQPFSLDGKRLTSPVFSKEGERQEGDRWMVSPFTQRGDGVHLFSPTSFLDGSWYHRSYWVYGRGAGEVWEYWHVPGRLTPTGRIMAIDDTQAYGYSRDPEYLCNSSVLEYRLYGSKLTSPYRSMYHRRKGKIKNDMTDWRERAKQPEDALTTVAYNWKIPHPPVVVRAMVVTEDMLLVAGPPDVVDEKEMWGRSNEPAFARKMSEQASALAGDKGGVLWLLGKSDGVKAAEYRLDSPPVFDGLIVADGRAFMSTTDGHVQCWAGK